MSSSEAALSERRRAIAFWAVLGGIWLVVAIMAFLSPLQGDDWLARAWIERYGFSPGALWTYTVRNHVVGDLVTVLLVTSRVAHVLLSPTIVCALLVAIVTFAEGRVPRPSDRGAALLVALASTFLWVGSPQLGPVLFHRAFLALFVYGFTALLWLLIAYRLAGERSRSTWPRAIAMLALGLIAGTSNHHVVPLAIIAVYTWNRARARAGRDVPLWMWSGLVGLVAGAALLFSDSPYVPWKFTLRVGFEHNLFRLYGFMAPAAGLVTLVMLIFFVRMIARQVRGAPDDPPSPTDVRLAGWGLGLGVLLALLGLFSPRWGEPAVLAPTVAIVIGALAVLRGPCTERWVAHALIALAVLVHVVVVIAAVPRYARAHAEFEDRVAMLAATPTKAIAKITPYDQAEPDYWFLGEDLGAGTIRAYVAWLYGVRAISMTTPFARYEAPAGLHFEEEIRDPGGAPRRLPLLTDDLEVARAQFREDVIERRHEGWDGTATLELVDFDWPSRRGRRLIAGRYHDHASVELGYEIMPIDRTLRMSVIVDPDSLEGGYPEAHLIGHGVDEPLSIDGDRYWISPQIVEQPIFLLCNADECLVITALWAQL